MTATSRYVRLLVLLSVFVSPMASATAASYTVGGFRITIPDQIPANEKIRGAIAVQRWSPMAAESTGKSDLDAFIVEQRLATITSGFADQNLSMSQIISEYAALEDAFDQVATLANRPELRYAGFIFQGCSVHGARSMSQAFGNPDRTIGVISFCGRNYALFSLLPSFSPFMNELSFPHLMVTNGGDTDRVSWNDATTRQVRDEARGLWTAALHPKLGHCEAAADGLKYELLWLAEVIKARVPATIPDGPYSLKALSDTSAWLGDYTPARSTNSGSAFGSGYKFDNAEVFAASTVPADQAGNYIWFPSRVAAEEWKNYADTGTCCLGVTDPTPSCGDGTCDASEDCGTCASDCACGLGMHCDAGVCTNDDVPPPSAPDCTAAFVSPLEGVVPLELTLDASGCLPGAEGQILEYEWVIAANDTEIARYDDATSMHTVSTPGNYDVLLRVWDANDESARVEVRRTVVARAPDDVPNDPQEPSDPATPDEPKDEAERAASRCDAADASLFASVVGLLLARRRRVRHERA